MKRNLSIIFAALSTAMSSSSFAQTSQVNRQAEIDAGTFSSRCIAKLHLAASSIGATSELRNALDYHKKNASHLLKDSALPVFRRALDEEMVVFKARTTDQEIANFAESVRQCVVNAQMSSPK